MTNKQRKTAERLIPVKVLVICAAIIIILQVAFSEIISSYFSYHMQNQRRSSVSKMVSTAFNTISPIVGQVRAGTVNREEALEKIRDIVRNMTYEDEFGPNYIFMSNYEGIMLVQPYEPAKEGTSQWDLKDANGKFIIRELIKSAKINPAGAFVTYSYFPPNKKVAEEKLSYVMGIPEIGAYIGTGMYMESSYKALHTVLQMQRYGYLIIIISILLFMFIYIRELHRAKQELQENHDELVAIYEELTATEEELRRNYEQLEEAQKEVYKTNERYRLIVEGANDIIWDWEALSNKLYVSERFYELLGYDKDEFEVTFDKWMEMVHPDDIDKPNLNFTGHTQSLGKRSSNEYRIKRKDGEYKWFMSSSKANIDQNGNVIRYAGSLSDITERKKQEETIRQMAYFDFLTGLPNRMFLLEEINDRVSKWAEDGQNGAVMFIDMDNFKIVNDTFGHAFGDKLLKIVSRRLQTSIQNYSNITLARLGGDEFILLMDGGGSESVVEDAAKALLSTFKEPVCFDGQCFYVTCSIGVALYPKDGAVVDDILKNADTAMYKAKALGRNCYVFFSSFMSDELTIKLDMENSLRDAVSKNELSLNFQPQIDTAKGEIIGFETLLRWTNPKYGMVSPVEFIPIAEEIKAIIGIGEWVIENACIFASKISKVAKKPLCISINVSPLQLMHENFVEMLLFKTSKHDVPPSSIGIEITETVLMESSGIVIEKLASLKTLGFHIYLDDFGTGYSSLKYLKMLPIDTVKIDKSFISDIMKDGIERKLVQSIISLAQNIGLNVVAEGVETSEQLDYLVRCNCNIIQGYLFSKPLSESDAERILEHKFKV